MAKKTAKKRKSPAVRQVVSNVSEIRQAMKLQNDVLKMHTDGLTQLHEQTRIDAIAYRALAASMFEVRQIAETEIAGLRKTVEWCATSIQELQDRIFPQTEPQVEAPEAQGQGQG